MSAEVEQATSVIGNLALSDISSWDEHYDNPKAEIILVSSDKVGFRVDAWQFKKESAFIRDLVTFPSDQAIELAPIELDYNSKIVRYFIDFVISGSTTNAQISMTEFEALFQLSDKFITEKVDKALLVAMELRVQHRLASKGLDPWAVFRLAAARDYPELARASIRAFEGAELLHSSIYEYDVSRFDGVSGKYVGGLMHAGYHKRHTWNNHRNTMTETIECRKWSEVADYFRVE